MYQTLIKHRLPIFISILSVLLVMAGDSVSAILRYESVLWDNNQQWRMISGHLIHLDGRHLGLNLAALWLIWLMFFSSLKESQWLILFLVLSISISLGLYLFSPAISWYVGLSGVLYGVFVTGLILNYEKHVPLSVLLILLLVSKLLLEQTGIIFTFLGEEKLVVVDAHFYGAVTGTISGLLLRKNNFII